MPPLSETPSEARHLRERASRRYRRWMARNRELLPYRAVAAILLGVPCLGLAVLLADVGHPLPAAVLMIVSGFAVVAGGAVLRSRAGRRDQAAASAEDR